MIEVATLRTLLATVPAEFVAARNDLAKQLRAAGERDDSDAVKALRRLGVSDWALNVAATENPDVIAAFADAAADVLDAQDEAMAGRGGGDLRDRMKTLRGRSAEVVTLAAAVAERHGQRGAGSSPIDLGTRLSEIAANRAAVELLRDGLIGAADPGVADPFGVMSTVRSSDRPAPRSSARSVAKEAPARKAPPAKVATSSGEVVGRGELERRRAERRARADAEQAAKAATAALAAAEAALAKAKAVAAKAGGRVADAEARLAELVAAQEAADATVAAADEARRRAVEDLERAQAALAASGA